MTSKSINSPAISRRKYKLFSSQRHYFTETVDIDELRELQSFKIARFIDERSPYLNVCSVFWHFGDTSYGDVEQAERAEMSMVLILSLNQVRRFTEDP